MRVHLDIIDGKVKGCEITGAVNQDAADLVEFLMDRQRGYSVRQGVSGGVYKSGAYPPAPPPMYLSVDVLREAVGLRRRLQQDPLYQDGPAVDRLGSQGVQGLRGDHLSA